MKNKLLFFSILLVTTSCEKQNQKPECLSSIENRLIELFDDGVFPETMTQITIDSYMFEDELVFLLPTTGWSLFHPATPFINENCDTIGHIISGMVNSTIFSFNSEFIETVWSYPE